MKGPATELIHAGETDLGIAVPLTTPIYETTTFVFENAAEVLAYNEGRSNKYLYSRYTNPTVVSLSILFEIPGAALIAGLFLDGQHVLLLAIPAAVLLVTGLAIVIRSSSRDAAPSVPVE